MGCLILAALVIGIGALVGYAWWTGRLGDLTSILALSRVPTPVYVERDQEAGLDEEPDPTLVISPLSTPTTAKVIQIGRTPTPPDTTHPTLQPLPVMAGTPYPQPVAAISAENVGAGG
jgi:hypothetical protein